MSISQNAGEPVVGRPAPGDRAQRRRLAPIARSMATLLIVVVCVVVMLTWSAGFGGDFLLAGAASGLLVRISYVVAVRASLILLALTAVALGVGDKDLASRLADLATYAAAVGCLWGLWELLLDRLGRQPQQASSGIAVVAARLLPQRPWHHRSTPAPRAAAQRPFPRQLEAVLSAVAGCVLAAAAGISGGMLSSHLSGAQRQGMLHVVPAMAPLLPPLPTPIPTTDCVASADTIASDGFDPYTLLAHHRPDVLAYYVTQGWNPTTQCLTIYDNWLQHGPDGTAPTTAVAFVRQHGWAPTTPQPTPTPLPDCTGPAAAVARLGFDPYALLAAHRPDVLQFYAQNPAPGGAGNWNPATQCITIFDNWLQRPDGGPPLTAAQYVVAHGWAPPTSSGPNLPPTPLPSPPPGGTAAPKADSESSYQA